MQLAKLLNAAGSPAVARVEGESLVVLDLQAAGFGSLADFLAADSPADTAKNLKPKGERIAISDAKVIGPDRSSRSLGSWCNLQAPAKQPAWEESETAASCYDRVYVSPRPELFFKATPNRCSGPDAPVRIRQDATWNVPEPELTLVLSPQVKAGRFHDWQRHELAGYRRR